MWAAVLTAALAVFFIDSMLQLEITASILYLPVIAAAFGMPGARPILVLAAFCSILACVDLYVTPSSDQPLFDLANCLLTLFSIWLTAGLCVRIKRSEERLSARNRYCIAVVDTALDAIVSMDAEGRIIDWNPQAERLLGWSKQEALGATVAELVVPPTHRDAHRSALRRYLTTGESSVLGKRLEMTALTRSGGEIPVEISISALRQKSGVTFNAFLRDVSERRELALYRARMAALVESSFDAIISKDLDRTIMTWNSGAEGVYGYTEEEAVGRSVAMLFPEGMEEEEPEVLQAKQEGRQLVRFETTRRRKDGKLIDISLTLSPIRDDYDVVIGYSTIERDITESRRIQRELLEAKEAAEHANRVRGEFLANVSHELRTPMNAILGMTELALEDEISETVRDYLETSQSAARSLLVLLNDILDFSRLESGRFSIEPAPFDLREVLHLAVEPLAASAFEKGVELICDLHADVPASLVGDAMRLRQILTNLVSNAVKFTEQGEVVVEIKPLRRSARTVKLEFSVTDTGVGIASDDVERILEPFTQVDASSTRKHAGTGLGLAICNQLLMLMGGQLDISSEIGKGSKFSFVLSLPFQDASRRSSRGQFPELQGLKALVVDDNATNRRILLETLSHWAIQVDAAADAEEALGKISREIGHGTPYSLIVVDALMPDVDGYTLSRQIREEYSSAPPVVLMASSADRREFRDREKSAQISAFVQKPISQDELESALRSAMGASPILRPTSREPRKDSRPTRTFAVLLAEDTAANQKVVSAMLKKQGHEVVIATNGREAVDQFARRRFDVVLMDVQMPILDGFQATRAIREMELDLGRRTPIVAMTAHAMRGDREKCLSAGMDDYLSKPIDQLRLHEVIQRVGDSESFSLTDQLSDSNDGELASGAEKSSPIDYEGVMKRLGNDVELFRDIVEVYRQDRRELATQIQPALEERDAQAVRRIAHSLKGLAANFGATECVNAAHALETSAKHETLENAEGEWRRLEQQLRRLDAALESHEVAPKA